MDPIPLQFGIPGGPELIVIFLIGLLLFGLPLLLIALAVVAYRNRRGPGDRVAELEGRIDELERELREERAGRSPGGGPEEAGEDATTGPGDA